MTTRIYIKGLTTGPPQDELIRDATGAIIDLSTGYTFAAKIVKTVTPTVLAGTKSTGITGLSGALGYNIRIDWETSDFTNLTAESTMYRVRLILTPSGGDPFEFPGMITFQLDTAPV